MAKKQGFKSVSIEPMTGLFDTQSTPDAVPANGYRWVQNMHADAGSRARRPGWERLFTSGTSPVGDDNADLHDQLLTKQNYYLEGPNSIDQAKEITTYPNSLCVGSELTHSQGVEPITSLFESVSTTGIRNILAATRSRVYVYSGSRRNWKIIADNQDAASEWQFSQVADTVVMTNNKAAPLSWDVEQATYGCDMQAAHTIESLDTIGLSRAAATGAFKGVNFFGNVVTDGIRTTHRIVWSDYQNATSYDPAIIASITGFQDLDFGERIMRFENIGDFMLVYTDKGIWAVAVSGETTFSFRKVYASAKGSKCLVYTRTLVSAGDTHYFMGADNIYAFNLSLPEPVEVDWMDACTNLIFDDLNKDGCALHAAGYNVDTKELWFSWVGNGDTYPDQSLVFNLDQSAADYVDSGFMAFLNHAPDTRNVTIADWLLIYCACPNEAAIETALGTDDIHLKEGGFCSGSGVVGSCGGVTINSIYTNSPKIVDGVVVEDYDLPNADADSLCAHLEAQGFGIDSACQECGTDLTFIMASSSDFCLKQYGTSYNRETNTNRSGCGTYTLDGYTSILRTGAVNYGVDDKRKLLKRVELEYTAEVQVTPSTLTMRVGYSDKAADPNIVGVPCYLKWNTQALKALSCITSTYDETSNVVPINNMVWPTFYRSNFLYFEFSIAGTGGASSFSRLSTLVKQL